MGGHVISERIVDESIRVDVVEHLEERGQEQLSSTPVKSASRVGNVADSSKPPSESQLRSSARVALMISEEEKNMYEVLQSGKTKNK